MKKKTLLYLKMIAFVVILVILDQISKFVATANLMGKSKYIVIKGLKDEAKNYLLEKGTDLKYGARPLRRAIQRYVEDELSDMILRKELENGKKVLVEYNKEENKLEFKVND